MNRYWFGFLLATWIIGILLLSGCSGPKQDGNGYTLNDSDAWKTDDGWIDAPRTVPPLVVDPLKKEGSA